MHGNLLHTPPVLALLSADMIKDNVICFPLGGMYLVFKVLYLASL